MSKKKNTLSKEQYELHIWELMATNSFAVIKTSQIKNFLNSLNQMKNNTQLTVEKENNGILPFLDVEVEKKLN